MLNEANAGKRVMKAAVFSAVHTAACRPEQSLIQCDDLPRAAGEDEFIKACVVPDRLLVKWQSMVDTSAELAEAPVALIMRVVSSDVKVLISSRSAENPYCPGDTAPLHSSGAYCKTVIRTGTRLLVPNALADSSWIGGAGTQLNLISYLGLPILWPSRRVFGTICVLDGKENAYSVSFERVLRQFRDVIEEQLASIYHSLETGNEFPTKPEVRDEAVGTNDVRLRTLIEGLTDEFIVHDESGRLLEVNRQACLNMGQTRDVLLTTNICQLPVRFDGDWNANTWALAQAGDMTTVRATRHDAKEGVRIIDARFSCQVAEGKKIFLGVIRDVTEHMTARPARGCEAVPAGRARATPPDTWRWNVKTARFSDATDYMRIVGRDLGTTSIDFDQFLEDVHFADRPIVRRTLLEAAKSGVPFRFECRLVTLDKPILYIECIGKPDDGDSSGGCFIGKFKEIASVKQAEDAMSETCANLCPTIRWAAIGELAASFVHEINQPLGVVANYAGAIKNWLSCPHPNIGEARDAASGLVDAAMCAGGIVSGLKIIARAPILNLADVGIGAAVREILPIARYMFEQREVRLHTRLPADDVTVCCDRALLQQLLLSLLHRAADSTCAGVVADRQVWLSCARGHNGHLDVAVVDNGVGVGVDESGRGELFEPSSMARTAEMGMGLSVCRAIIDAHGGRLWTESRSEGGTAFRFVLPSAKLPP